MTTDHHKLQQQLQQELALTQSLQQCLVTEREALEQQDSDALVANATHKGQLVESLEAATRQRETLLTQAGYQADRESMQRLLDASNNPQLATTWETLNNVIQWCHEENRQLGRLIQREQNSVRQAQHILQRGAPADNHSYDASGQSNSNGNSRDIAKA